MANPASSKPRRFLRGAGLGAAGLTMTGLGAIEILQPMAAPCPIVSQGVVRSVGPIRRVRAGVRAVDQDW